MKKNYFLLVCFSLSIQMASAQNTWTQKANMGGFARMGAIGFSIGSKGYMGTGGDFGSNYYDDFWEYDPVTDSWTQKANFAGGARYRAVGYSVGSKGYVGTGYNGTAFSDFWEYDPATNIWTALANYGGMTKFGSTGFAIGNKIYTGTGTGASGYSNDFWEYDVQSNAWTQKANFGGLPKIYAAGFSIGAYGYIGTGVDLNNNPFGSKDFWEYDTTLNVWNQKANFPGTERSEALGFSVGNYGYIGTGTSDWGVGGLDDFWKYFPLTDTWVQVATYGGGVIEEGAAFVIDCKAYVGSGIVNDASGTCKNDFWMYSPDSTFCTTGANFVASSTSFCVNDCIDFTDVSSTNPFAWQWFFPGSATPLSNMQNPVNICYNSPGDFDVTLIAYNIAGSDTLTFQNYIHVDSVPFFTLGPDTIFCSGDSVLVDAGSGFNTYAWSTGATTQTIYVSSQGSYTVEITKGSCSVSDTLLVTAQICASTIALFSCSDTNFCEKSCIDFTDLSTNIPTSWQWFFPGADSTSSNLQNPTNICYNSYGSFDVILIACNAVGCDTITMTNFINEYQPPPVPVVTSNPDTLFSSPASTYQWYFNSLPIAGATNQYYIYPQQGGYFVVITDSNGCASSSGSIYTLIDELTSAFGEIKVSPNPSDGHFEINYSGFLNKPLEVKVFDALGRILISAKPETSRYQINLNVTDGIYFLEVKAGEKVFRNKLMVKG